MAYFEYRPTKILFHYTSKGGFESIIANKRLWFSDLSYSNDPREMNFGYDTILSALRNAKSSNDDEKIEYILDLINRRLVSFMKNNNIYCCCFTYSGDRLPMWRAYGDNCAGLSIGFRPTALLDIQGRVQKVRYIENDSSVALSNIITNMARSFGRPLDLYDEIGAIAAMSSTIVTLKHDSWAYEEEIRLTHSQINKAPDAWDPEFVSYKGINRYKEYVRWAEPLIRTSGDLRIPYFEFEYGRMHRDRFDARGAIEKVIIGPKCSYSINDVEKIMSGNEFKNFSIIKSDCLIR